MNCKSNTPKSKQEIIEEGSADAAASRKRPMHQLSAEQETQHTARVKVIFQKAGAVFLLQGIGGLVANVLLYCNFIVPQNLESGCTKLLNRARSTLILGGGLEGLAEFYAWKNR